jgi:hypothetical protein
MTLSVAGASASASRRGASDTPGYRKGAALRFVTS